MSLLRPTPWGTSHFGKFLVAFVTLAWSDELHICEPEVVFARVAFATRLQDFGILSLFLISGTLGVREGQFLMEFFTQDFGVSDY